MKTVDLELYMARDKDGALFGYKNEPVRVEEYGCFNSADDKDPDFIQFADEWLPEVTWDNSPVKMKIQVEL